MHKHTHTKRNLSALGAILAGALALVGCSGGPGEESAGDTEVDFSQDDITFIVPYPAGSGPDAWARVVAGEMESELSTNIIVENKEGGASTIGLFDLANADPDGFTIGLGSFSGISLQSRLIDNPFGGLETLTPIAQAKAPAFLLFGGAGDYDSIEAFIDDAKSRPGEITVGVPNPNSVPDVLVRLLEESADIDLSPVYFDAGQQVLPVTNGTVDVGIAQAGPVVQFVDDGQLDYIGVLGSEPAPGLDVPLFDDAGADTSTIADVEGVFGPAGMPDEVVDALSDAVGTGVESDEFIELMDATYSSAVYLDGTEFAARMTELDEAAERLIDELELGQ